MTDADGQATFGQDELEQLAERVDGEIEALDEYDPVARERALALKRAVEAFHRAGLVTVVRRLRTDPRGLELLLELLSEPAVRVLFAMHGIVRTSAPADGQVDLVQIRLPVVAVEGPSCA